MKASKLRSLRRRAAHGVSRLLLKAKISRSRQLLHLPPEAVGDLLLFQYNVGSAKFYTDTIGHVPIRVSESPHALFAREASASQHLEDGQGQSIYRAFLEASWSALPGVRSGSAGEKVQRLWQFTKLHQQNKASAPPITVTMMPDENDLYIVDGNHRAAVALALASPLRAFLIPFDLVFFRYLAPFEYYGSGHRGRPYQTIYYNQKPVIYGRRTDILERLDLIPKEVLAEAAVLDIGSNFGMNALAAAWRGASSVLGLEQSNQLANTATRLAVLNGLYPRVMFSPFDVDTDTLPSSAQFDVCFMLSVFQHLRDPGKLLRIVDRNVRKWVIFEGHPGSDYELYASFLESRLFESVEPIGELSHSAADGLTRRRPLWLCTRGRRFAPSKRQ